MNLVLKLTAVSQGHAQRWVTLPGGPAAAQVAVTKARFEAVAVSPDGSGVPIDPVAFFEIETSDNTMFAGLNLTKDKFDLTLANDAGQTQDVVPLPTNGAVDMTATTIITTTDAT